MERAMHAWSQLGRFTCQPKICFRHSVTGRRRRHAPTIEIIIASNLLPNALTRVAELAMAADTRGEALCARECLARGDHLEPAAKFVLDRRFLREIPLTQRRQPVCAQASLGEPRDL